MHVDVQLEFREGRILSFIEDSAGIFASVLKNSPPELGLLTAIESRGEKPFAHFEMPAVVGQLKSLLDSAEGTAGRRHVEQVTELAVRCQADRSMQLLFLSR